eukprot:SAG31_NODE_3140_length_4629_cov_2.504636_3_plen_261_part_00
MQLFEKYGTLIEKVSALIRISELTHGHLSPNGPKGGWGDAGSPHLLVKSPFSNSPGRLLAANDDRPAPRAVLFGEPDGSEPDPYDLVTGIPGTRAPAVPGSTTRRQPLGTLNANTHVRGLASGKDKTYSNPQQLESNIGIACAVCQGWMQADDAGNLQCLDCQEDRLYNGNERAAEPDRCAAIVESEDGWAGEEILSLHLPELDAEQIDRNAAASSFKPKLVGGHMPYFCRSETCGLAHVHKITNGSWLHLTATFLASAT